MRDIKFRAWSKFSETMYEVRELRFNRGTLLLRKDGLSLEKDFENIELMQYTGLHDKNGKEIYEGDILKYISFVEFKTFFLTVMWSDDYGAFVVKNENEFYLLSDLVSSDLEIVGNIYENFDLISSKI